MSNENYRPISLTSITCKVLESIIRDQLMEHLVKNNLIVGSQHGFVPKKGCVSNLLETLDTITSDLAKGTSIDEIYLDFSKAFDTVPHKRLLHKLRGYGLSEKMVCWFDDFLSGRMQRVVLGDSKSGWKSRAVSHRVLLLVLFVLYYK